MIATLAGATVVTDVGSDVRSGSAADVGLAVGLDEAAEIGAEVGPGGTVNSGTVAEPDEGVEVATGTGPGTASVAEIPQANIPSTTAIRGGASSRDILDYPQPSRWTAKKLANHILPHLGIPGLKLRLFVPRVQVLIRKPHRQRIYLFWRVQIWFFCPVEICEIVRPECYTRLLVWGVGNRRFGPYFARRPMAELSVCWVNDVDEPV